MNFLSNPVVARLLWALPLLLVVIAVATTRAGLQQRAVAEAGTTVEAEVTGLNLRERSEITTGQVALRYTPPGLPAPVAAMIAQSDAAAAEGALDDESGDLERLLGRPPTPLADAVAEARAGQ